MACHETIWSFDPPLSRRAAAEGASARDCGATDSKRSRCSRREATSTITTRLRFESLKDWLTEARLELHSVHAPITDVVRERPRRSALLHRAPRHDARKATLHEMEAALQIAKIVPVQVPRRAPRRARRAAARRRTTTTATRPSAASRRFTAMAEAARRESRARSDGQRPFDRTRPGRAARAQLRGRRSRHLHGRRPRAHARATPPKPSRRRRNIWSRRTSTTTAGRATTISSPFRATSTGPPPSWPSRRSATMEC